MAFVSRRRVLVAIAQDPGREPARCAWCEVRARDLDRMMGRWEALLVKEDSCTSSGCGRPAAEGGRTRVCTQRRKRLLLAKVAGDSCGIFLVVRTPTPSNALP